MGQQLNQTLGAESPGLGESNGAGDDIIGTEHKGESDWRKKKKKKTDKEFNRRGGV